MVVVRVKWKSEMYDLQVQTPSEFRVAELKDEIFSLTEVLPTRQKLLVKGKTMKDSDAVSVYFPGCSSIAGAPADSTTSTSSNMDIDKNSTSTSTTNTATNNSTIDSTISNAGGEVITTTTSSSSCTTSNTNSKNDINVVGPVLMLGSTEADLQYMLEPPEVDDVVDDFDEDEAAANPSETPVICENDLLKIRQRVEKAADYIEVLEAPRPGKKLLVLDIDYTFFDHRSPAERADLLRRPYLFEFLTAVYESYDIAIWSATSRKWIDLKLRELGVIVDGPSTGTPTTTSNRRPQIQPGWKIHFILDARAMVSTHAPAYGGVVRVKPLEVVWQVSKLQGQHYSQENTIMFDDLRRNFLLNPQNGLRIRAFKKAQTEGLTDCELLFLKDYLLAIAKLQSFSELNHRKWESYISRPKGEKRRKKTEE